MPDAAARGLVDKFEGAASLAFSRTARKRFGNNYDCEDHAARAHK